MCHNKSLFQTFRSLFLTLLVTALGAVFLFGCYQLRIGGKTKIPEMFLPHHIIPRPKILHKPAWVSKKEWGISKFHSRKMTPGDFAGSSMDNEAQIAWEYFFKDTTNGLVLELGAMDGKSYSASKFFEEHAGWKSILIEASNQATEIPKNRPSALSLQMAICEEESIIHFLNAKDIGGILEFMTIEYLRYLHPEFIKAGLPNNVSTLPIKDLLNWDTVHAAKNVVEQPCLPLRAVFDRFKIDRINFLVLDLEGGEMGALKSLDFNRIEFDVLCIETNRLRNPSDPYIDEVVNFVQGKGYHVHNRTIGRNSWFVSPKWKILD